MNTKSQPGSNIPCDSFMEHLNGRLKGVIHSVSGNINPSVIQKASKAIEPVYHVCKIFKMQTAKVQSSDKHAPPQFAKDLSTILNVLWTEKVIDIISGRNHPTFKFKCGLMEKLSKTEQKLRE